MIIDVYIIIYINVNVNDYRMCKMLVYEGKCGRVLF